MIEQKPNIPLMKSQIEAQISEYERAIAEYEEFMKCWRERESAALARAGMA